jgi:hypothetical protein
MALGPEELENPNDKQKKTVVEIEKYIDKELINMTNIFSSSFSIVLPDSLPMVGYGFPELKVRIELIKRYQAKGWKNVVFKKSLYWNRNTKIILKK